MVNEKLKNYLLKHRTVLWNIQRAVLLVTLAVTLFSAPGEDKITALFAGAGENGITGLASGPLVEEDASTFFSGIKGKLFLFASIAFIINIVTTMFLLLYYRAEDYLVGGNEEKYTTPKDLTLAFAHALAKTQSRLAGKEYTVFLFNKVKEKRKKSPINFINITLSPQKQFKVKIDKGIEALSEQQTRNLLRLLLKEFGGKEEEAFSTLLKYEITPELRKALERTGIVL